MGLLNIFVLVLPLVASFFLAMDNGEFNNSGGGAAADSGYNGSGSKVV